MLDKITTNDEIQQPKFEKMTVIQLRQYMKQHGIKPLGGRKSDIIDRIKEFQKIGIDTNSIYKNDLKSSYNNNIYSKMKVNDLKDFMRSHSIKGLNQKKELLIKTILDAGYELPMMEKPRKLSKKEKKMKSYYTLDSKNTKKEESMEQLLKKRKMVDLVNLLDKIGIRPKKIPKKKQELVDKLVKYYEMSSMSGEDVNQSIPMALPFAEAYLPIPENIQNAIHMDHLYSGDYTEGEYINRSSLDPTHMKYNPADIEQHYQDQEDEYVSSNANRYARIDMSMNDLYEMLPIEIVKEKLKSTNNDVVEFVSPYTLDRYDAEDLSHQIRNSEYDRDGWNYDVFSRDGKWILEYTRRIPKRVLESENMFREDNLSRQIRHAQAMFDMEQEYKLKMLEKEQEILKKEQEILKKEQELKKKKIPVSVYTIEESIPSSSPVDKKLTIKKKPNKKPFSIDEYNFNKIVDNWNESSILDDFKMYYPSEYNHIHDLFKMHVNKMWGNVTVTDGDGKKTKQQGIYPAQIAGWLSTKLITSLKKKYTPQKIYDGCYTLAYTLGDELGIINDMDQLQDDGEDIEKYLN